MSKAQFCLGSHLNVPLPITSWATRMLIGLDALEWDDLLMVILFFLVETWSHGVLRSNQLSPGPAVSLSIWLLPTLLQKSYGLHIFCVSFMPYLRAFPLYCDTIKVHFFLTQNPVSHKRAKHIDLDYHFVRELVASSKLHTKYVSTNLQVADIFTKSLPRHLFERFRAMLCLGPPPVHLRGGIR